MSNELPICLFCFDPLKEEDRYTNTIGCSCVLHTHARCMAEWVIEKRDLECPVCHTIQLRIPIDPPPLELPPPILILREVPPEPEFVQGQEQHRNFSLSVFAGCIGFSLLVGIVVSFSIEYS